VKHNDLKAINQLVLDGSIEKYIIDWEKESDQRIENLAESFEKNVDDNRIVMLAGPSSSAKTTFTLKLEKYLEEGKM
jgi:tRNA A37 threonylcarbamoyladenosine biosynthesis protein TsaE